ncbi:MAG: RNA-binding S4 domain-containing protein [Porphyromonadaceae bacterium]|nr:MAG: RNA-binding S4 domain-containing protein [Porphyromonadaceae bacterium]
MGEGVRIDKWLWAVRIFKSRSLATDFCKHGRILIGDEAVKPSRNIHIGDIIVVRKPPLILTYQVTGLIAKRGSATLAAENVINLTPQEELDRAHQAHESAFYVRDRGTGRPTKKDRRNLNKMDI